MSPGASDRKVIIIAGPNGAGKTTFARTFLPVEAQLPRFINADLIAVGLAPFAPETAAVRAGRLMLEEIQTSVCRGESFALETTLSGRGYLRHVEEWRSQGYRVSLIFLSLSDVETAIARVAERVRQGGHDVPEAVIRRRFAAGRKNFDTYFRGEVDDWAVYDTSGGSPVLLDWGESMTEKDLSKASNLDLRASFAAMRRAAELARQVAIQTNTALVVVREGELVRISGERLREDGEAA